MNSVSLSHCKKNGRNGRLRRIASRTLQLPAQSRGEGGLTAKLPGLLSVDIAKGRELLEMHPTLHTVQQGLHQVHPGEQPSEILIV